MLRGVCWGCERHDGQWWRIRTVVRELILGDEVIERGTAVLDLCLVVIWAQSSIIDRCIWLTITDGCMLQPKGALSTVAEDVARVEQHRSSLISPHKVWTARYDHDLKYWICLAVSVYSPLQHSISLGCRYSKQKHRTV